MTDQYSHADGSRECRPCDKTSDSLSECPRFCNALTPEKSHISATKSHNVSDIGQNTESALAFAGILERYARRIRGGFSAEDAANELIPVLIVAARRV